MPFGLANSPSVFLSFLNDIFKDMLNQWVVVYIDNILHMRSVLQRLIQHQLYTKMEKCEFHQSSMVFLGYFIGSEGVAMDDKKVRAVVEWPQPKTVRELQRFLGFINFYRRFICNFSTVAAPLTSLLRGGNTKLSWTPSAHQGFLELRARFTSAPIHPVSNHPFIVEVDASNSSIGAVLSQRQGTPPQNVPLCILLT
ncbi:hypothetical protein IRJ41_019309 [Triplophysa rosa]|uniref:ribonuclease H n=1 Tax=Triplophysa rosa TaxID=992332 RepID=A0A9W7WI50_TRIRA|nr:hypothetical protein IRJ41_019309 [Triplophysa rosa]